MNRAHPISARPVLAALGTATLLAIVLAIPAARAGTGASLSVRPDFPPTVTVGQRGIPVDVVIQNTSQHDQGPVTIAPGALTLTPSCGSLPGGAAEPCPTPDPGVFALGGTGTGQAGTSCAGAVYSIVPTGVTGTGEVQFSGPAIVLSATDANDINGGRCAIDFTVDVIKAPRVDALPTTPGIQTGELANAGGTTAQNLPAGCCGSSVSTVAPVTPAITTKASLQVALGGQISDTATLSGGVAPTGVIAFAFFAPADTNCAGPPVFTATATVNGPGPYSSGPFTPKAPGTYRSTAAYSGDSSNAPVVARCNDSGESVVVTSVLGLSTAGRPALPVTGPEVPAGPLALAAFGMLLLGAVVLRRSRRGGA